MAESNVALEVFTRALLEAHNENLSDTDISEEQLKAFSESDLISMAESLWIDRYSDSRQTFKQCIGLIISEKVDRE